MTDKNRGSNIRGTWRDDPWHFCRPTRRDMLQVGFVGGLGLTLGDALRAEASQQPRQEAAKAKSIIYIFLSGGMASQESFDPKPLAPVEYRGPFGTVSSAIDGERFCNLFDDTAKVADKLTVVRSMTHTEAAHERGQRNMWTGYQPSPAIEYPSFGSVIAHEQGPRNNLPAYVAVPNEYREGGGTGFLGSAYGPFSLGSDPANNNFRVRDLAMPSGVDMSRFERRRSLLSVVDDHFSSLERSDAIEAMDEFYQRAYAMVSSKEAREAFDIDAEPDSLRDEYGRNQPGQRMLMARRLVEAGVRFVGVTTGSWDHHDNIEQNMNRHAPPTDQAFATLIRDLDDRGMLDDTLVVLSTEFGRTPRINGTAGRDHHPRSFSIVMAGGGLKKGYIHGETNATLTDVETDPLRVPDLAATMYELLGVDWDRALTAPGPRPIQMVNGGQVARQLIA